MSSSEISRFLVAASRGRMTRRQVLERGLGLGLSSAMILSLMEQAPEAAAAPAQSLPLPNSALQAREPGVLNICFVDGATDIDPHSSYTTTGGIVLLTTYDMLIKYKGESTSEYLPMLAESCEASDDLKTFTFKIRSNVVFHDGTPCDAQAVKNSFIRFRRMEMGPYLVIARFCDDPENMMEVVDPTTIRFNLTESQPLFLPAMACSWGPFIASMKPVDENKTDDDPWAHEWFLQNTDGTGPYKLIENNFTEGLKFEWNDQYWGKPLENGIKTINVRIVPENSTRRQLIENGELDLLTNQLTQEDYTALRTDSRVQVLDYSTARVDWIILNYKTLNTDARKGLCYAFPYDDVIAGVYAGQVKRTGPVADNILGYDPNEFVFQTDLDQAKTLLASGGFAEGSTISMMIDSETVQSKTTAELFQANLSQIGINLDIQTVDLATMEDTVYGDAPPENKPHMIGVWAWWPDYNDGWNQLAPNFLLESAGGGGSNAGWYNNPQFEEVMDKAQASTNLDELAQLVKQCTDIVVQQDPGAIFIGQIIYTTVADPSLRGFNFNPLYLEQYFFNEYYRETA
jgi:peptide/nickel transport system substrate-binding protein